MQGKWKPIVAAALVALAAPMAWSTAHAGGTAGGLGAVSAGLAAPTSQPPQMVAPEYLETGDPATGAVHAGTPAAATQPVPAYRGGSTFAILGDAAPVNEATPGYLQQTVDELNRLRPDLVLTTGNQVQGYTRSVEEYGAEAAGYRKIMARLEMPAYFCAGDHDVESGSRDPSDRQFEKLYQKCFGPLYYSVDFRDLHIITLYSEAGGDEGPALHDAQLAWLAGDLNRTFESHKFSHVYVIVHRPLWRDPHANWDHVQRLLVEFNQRPIVAVEGFPGQSVTRSAPQVDAVFAGHDRTYCVDPARDGIAYYVLGPLGGRVEGDPLAGQMQHYTLVHVDSSGTHLALVRPGNVLPGNFVTRHDQQILARIAAMDDKALGVGGVLEQPVGREVGVKDSEKGTLEEILTNPLDVPIDVEIRMASMKNLVTQLQKDQANAYADSYDSSWELYVPYSTMHLDPGEKHRYKMALFSEAQGDEVPPPQVEFVVNWIDSKGRTVPTVLKRRVPLIPSATIPLIHGGPNAAAWEIARHAATYSWLPNPDDKAQASPEFLMMASPESLFIKVQVSGKPFPNYFAKFDEPWNLPCDAISVAWAPSENSWDSSVRRAVVVWPTSAQPEIYGNAGVGASQTKLVKRQDDGIRAMLSRKNDSYEVIIILPRSVVLPGGSGVLNVTVTNNDGGAVSTWRSWAREDLGPKVWGRVKVEEAK